MYFKRGTLNILPVDSTDHLASTYPLDRNLSCGQHHQQFEKPGQNNYKYRLLFGATLEDICMCTNKQNQTHLQSNFAVMIFHADNSCACGMSSSQN